MEEAKKIINDSAKFDAALELAWKKLDPDNNGKITFETALNNLKLQAKSMGIPNRNPTPEEKEAIKKMVDPERTGNVTKENYIKFMKNGAGQCKTQ